MPCTLHRQPHPSPGQDFDQTVLVKRRDAFVQLHVVFPQPFDALAIKHRLAIRQAAHDMKEAAK